MPYVDPSRSAIWGWSYGGYASGMALAQDTEGVFKCGISVAPVTDWALYGKIICKLTKNHDKIFLIAYWVLPTLV